MRFTRMTNLIAMSFMAFIGASSAMASNTQLCSSDPANGACPAGTAVTSVHFVDPQALLFSELLGVKKDLVCEALFSGTALGLGAPQIIHGNYTYSNCEDSLRKEKCTSVKEVSEGGLLNILKTGIEVGQVKGEAFEVLIECSGLHCIYNAAGLVPTFLGSLIGGNGGFFSNSATINKISGFLCPSTTKLTSKFESLAIIYVGV